MNTPLLDVRNLAITFHGASTTEAVRGVSFSVGEGKTVAIVGESGSGKSVTALALTRLLPPPPVTKLSGEILFRGVDLLRQSEAELRRIRGAKIAYIFQEPSSSLNPVFTVGHQVAEAVRLHRPEIADVTEEVIRALDLVGIRDPELRHKDYPHQLSGGMQQRVMIAMALACRPALLVADEPTTALDVTIQAQIIDLLKKLKAELGMAILMITHNFGIVHGFADEVVVMFRGKIVEHGPTERVLRQPEHSYTKALIACIPRLGRKQARLTTIDHAALDAAG